MVSIIFDVSIIAAIGAVQSLDKLQAANLTARLHLENADFRPLSGAWTCSYTRLHQHTH